MHTEQEEAGTIEAAPIIAVIDEYSGAISSSLPGRYATLAAVMGVRSTELDVMKLTRQDPFSSEVRLIGIGRALIHGFHYKTPSDRVKDEYEEEYEEDVPILMASFELLLDGNEIKGEEGAEARHVSPVHAVAELHRKTNSLTRLHDERRKTVAGLKAGRMRLANRRKVQGQDAIASTLEEYPNTIPSRRPLAPKSRFAGITNERNNYGISTYSIFSSIPDLSRYALQIFKPYFSQKYRSREEYIYEVSSFVALRCLEGLYSPHDLATSLLCINSKERLDFAYDLMLQHHYHLRELAEEVNLLLDECGEECTDLW